MKIDKVSLAVEVDGSACFVVLGQDKLQILITLAQGLFDDGVIKVVKAPPTYQFCAIEDME